MVFRLGEWEVSAATKYNWPKNFTEYSLGVTSLSEQLFFCWPEGSKKSFFLKCLDHPEGGPTIAAKLQTFVFASGPIWNKGQASLVREGG